MSEHVQDQNTKRGNGNGEAAGTTASANDANANAMITPTGGDPNALAMIIQAHPAAKHAILMALQQTLGNTVVRSVVELLASPTASPTATPASAAVHGPMRVTVNGLNVPSKPPQGTRQHRWHAPRAYGGRRGDRPGRGIDQDRSCRAARRSCLVSTSSGWRRTRRPRWLEPNLSLHTRRHRLRRWLPSTPHSASRQSGSCREARGDREHQGAE